MLIKQKDFKSFLQNNWKYIPLLLGGFLFYKIASAIINAYYHITLTEYQGIGQIHLLPYGNTGRLLLKFIMSYLTCFLSMKLSTYIGMDMPTALYLLCSYWQCYSFFRSSGSSHYSRYWHFGCCRRKDNKHCLSDFEK